MYYYRGFPHLDRKKWVQVKGQPADDGTFTALEITVASDEEDKIIRVQGVVQAVDVALRKVQLSNACIRLPENMKVHLKDGSQVDFSELQTGEVLRINGSYNDQGTFIPEELLMQKTFEFNLDKLFGCIEQVNETRKTFEMFGLPITVSTSTSIELS